jgi:hypothetical protein
MDIVTATHAPTNLFSVGLSVRLHGNCENRAPLERARINMKAEFETLRDREINSQLYLYNPELTSPRARHGESFDPDGDVF